jgi:hypothetical protein
MMNNKQYQQLILALIKEQEPPVLADELYAAQLKNSIELEIARDVSIWWRSMQLERYCFITANYLKLTSQFDKLIKAFYLQTNVSPYIERAGQSFLDYLQQADDKVLATIANFEDKLKRVKKGDSGNYSIYWSHEPFSLLDALISGKPLELESMKGKYLTIINAQLENQFEVFDMKNSNGN